ncbi:hypothetical protein QE372_004108 [Agrobacterium pusense]|nr:hypothetical protein [Agrobacterium pusense]
MLAGTDCNATFVTMLEAVIWSLRTPNSRSAGRAHRDAQPVGGYCVSRRLAPGVNILEPDPTGEK